MQWILLKGLLSAMALQRDLVSNTDVDVECRAECNSLPHRMRCIEDQTFLPHSLPKYKLDLVPVLIPRDLIPEMEKLSGASLREMVGVCV